jgi:hypothetical protein
MKKKESKSKKRENIVGKFYKLVNILNDNKFFAGIIMLIMNIGSKYLTVELSKTQENYIKYSLGRQIIIFSILWVGTRDIAISLILTILFVVSADYLFNENSKYCIIPEQYKELRNEIGKDIVTQKEVNDAINTLKRAKKNKENNNQNNNQNYNEINNEKQENEEFINNTLYKENFI